ncbi:hypothetical protein [Arthrobacter sp. 754]|uniref:hypothetical protein n=1 Tax=Arthrobacter sp. 754 TaxID=3156315 RepID=UPI003394BAF5
MPLMVETIGWFGSALILVSLAQARPRRLHLLNLGACIVLIAYNALIGAVPGIGLNAGLILVNLWRLRTLPQPGTSGPAGMTDSKPSTPVTATESAAEADLSTEVRAKTL